MNAETDRRGPVDCLRRGLLSLVANWQLIPLLVAQTLLTTGLLFAGGFVLLAALGVSVVAWVRGLGSDWPQQLAEELVTSLEAAPPPLLPLILPLIAATLVWTLAFGLYCYLQGGVVGVLAEAERAAGAGRPGWQAFRSFSAAGFDLQGRRLFWRYFWFNHLLAVVLLVWALLLVGLVALAVRLATGPETAAGVAIGCVGLVPLMLMLLAIALWSMLATVEVARPESGVWDAGRRALEVLRRRLVPVLVLWLLAVAGWLVVGVVFAPLEWGVGLASGDRLGVLLGARGVLLLVETVAQSGVFVAWIAALAALVGLPTARGGETAA